MTNQMNFLSFFFLFSFFLIIFSSCEKEYLGSKQINSQWSIAEADEYPPADVPYYITHKGISSIENNNTFTLEFNANPNYNASAVDNYNSNINALEPYNIPPQSIHCYWEATAILSTPDSKVISHKFDSDEDDLTISIPDIHTQWTTVVSLSYGNLSSSKDFDFTVIIRDGEINFSENTAIDRGSEVLRHTSSMILLRL